MREVSAEDVIQRPYQAGPQGTASPFSRCTASHGRINALAGLIQTPCRDVTGVSSTSPLESTADFFPSIYANPDRVRNEPARPQRQHKPAGLGGPTTGGDPLGCGGEAIPTPHRGRNSPGRKLPLLFHGWEVQVHSVLRNIL